MTEIEKKALALVNEVREGRPYTIDEAKREYGWCFQAVCIAIGRDEAYRQEVSDAVESTLHSISHWQGCDVEEFRAALSRSIIAKPDPLVEALCHCVPLTSERAGETPAEYVARSVREWLSNQGLSLKIVEDK